jgi:hypothetical protein
MSADSTAASPALASLARCFQGVVPSAVCTTDPDGLPNIILVSQVYRVDEHRVALSRQFFSKTTRNLEATRRAVVEVLDPLTLEAYRLRLAFVGSETSGPLFDAMALRIQAIASHTGMSGIFRLIAADVFEVERLEKVEGFLTAVPEARPGDEISGGGMRTELRGLQWVSDRINRSPDLDSLLDAVLEALDTFFGFRHAMVLLAEEPCARLVAMASRGYGDADVGAEVAVGDGLIGTVARERRVLRISGLDQGLSYGRAIRREVFSAGDGGGLGAEIPLPGLPDARSALVIPLAVRDRLVGVLAAESREPMAFDEWHEAYLEVLGNQIALGVERMIQAPATEERDEPKPIAPDAPPAPEPSPAAAGGGLERRLAGVEEPQKLGGKRALVRQDPGAGLEHGRVRRVGPRPQRRIHVSSSMTRRASVFASGASWAGTNRTAALPRSGWSTGSRLTTRTSSTWRIVRAAESSASGAMARISECERGSARSIRSSLTAARCGPEFNGSISRTGHKAG